MAGTSVAAVAPEPMTSRRVPSSARFSGHAWGEGASRFGPQVLDRLVQALARYRELAKIPDWQQKVRFSVHAARAAVVARYYNPHAPLPKDRRELAYCMRRLVPRYVGLPEAAGS